MNAWIKFFEANGRDRSTTPELAGLRNRKMLAEVSEKEFKLAAKKLEYVLSREVRAEWERLCGHAATVLRAKFEAELPPILAGLDATGIQAEFRKAIDEVLQALHET